MQDYPNSKTNKLFSILCTLTNLKQFVVVLLHFHFFPQVIILVLYLFSLSYYFIKQRQNKIVHIVHMLGECSTQNRIFKTYL